MTALPQDHVWTLSMTDNSLDIYTFLNTCSFFMWSWRHNNTALGQVRCRCTKTSFWIYSRCQSNEVSWREEPCHHSVSAHLWWGWGLNTLASQIYGGKKQVRFPGYLTVDGFPFPAVSSYGLIAAHSRLHFGVTATNRTKLPSKTQAKCDLHKMALLLLLTVLWSDTGDCG